MSQDEEWARYERQKAALRELEHPEVRSRKPRRRLDGVDTLILGALLVPVLYLVVVGWLREAVLAALLLGPVAIAIIALRAITKGKPSATKQD